MHSRSDSLGYCAIILIVVLCCTNCANAEDAVDSSSSSVQEGRTFGHHFLKRISFAIIPAAFTVGVITTLLAALTIVSMKGLGVGVILLVISVGQIFSRLLPAAAPIAYAAPAPAPAPYPVIYARRQDSVPDPVWIEKDYQPTATW